MSINEQIFLVFEGAMGVHRDRKKKEKMPFRLFKKTIGLILNCFLKYYSGPPHRQGAKAF